MISDHLGSAGNYWVQLFPHDPLAGTFGTIRVLEGTYRRSKITDWHTPPPRRPYDEIPRIREISESYISYFFFFFFKRHNNNRTARLRLTANLKVNQLICFYLLKTYNLQTPSP